MELPSYFFAAGVYKYFLNTNVKICVSSLRDFKDYL